MCVLTKNGGSKEQIKNPLGIILLYPVMGRNNAEKWEEIIKDLILKRQQSQMSVTELLNENQTSQQFSHRNEPPHPVLCVSPSVSQSLSVSASVSLSLSLSLSLTHTHTHTHTLHKWNSLDQNRVRAKPLFWLDA